MRNRCIEDWVRKGLDVIPELTSFPYQASDNERGRNRWERGEGFSALEGPLVIRRPRPLNITVLRCGQTPGRTRISRSEWGGRLGEAKNFASNSAGDKVLKTGEQGSVRSEMRPGANGGCGGHSMRTRHLWQVEECFPVGWLDLASVQGCCILNKHS